MEKHKLSDLSFIVSEWPINNNKPTLLFIHAAGATALSWTFQLQDLGGSVNIIAIDLPGHGDSGGTGLNNIPDYAKTIAGFINKLRITRCIPAGISMGGAIAQQLLVDYPEIFLAAVLINTGAKLKVLPDIFDAIKTDSRSFMANLINYILPADLDADHFSPIIDDVIEIRQKVILEDFTACNNFDLRNRLNEIKVPVLIISSENDTMTPLWYGEYLHKNIINSVLKIIPSAGHLVTVEKSELVNLAIKDFISNLK